MTAKIIRLCERRAEREPDVVDLRTAVDVAIRDMHEIQSHWGTDLARIRLVECQDMLRRVFAAS